MRVVIVGAGLSGLVAARQLDAAGVDVTVLDKGRSVGGRLATRRIGDATLDHGAQFFTVRTPAFETQVTDWRTRGLVHVWNHGFDSTGARGSADGGDGDGEGGGDGSGDGKGGDGHERFVGTAGMNSLAKDLAADLVEAGRVECSTMAFAVRPADGGERWHVVIDDGTIRPADAVVLTCPLPQAFALLVDSGAELDESLFRTDYDRTIGLLVRLDRPGAIPAPGGVQNGDPTFSFIGDNRAKGVSAVPAVTFHANPEWSETHWDDGTDDLLDALERAAAPWLGDATIVERQLKKWRLATPRSIWPDPCWTAADGTIVLAGDAFAGPRMEGAHNSGLAAAHALLA